MDGSRGGLYSALRDNFMAWFTSPHLSKRLERQESLLRRLAEEQADLAHNLSETSHEVRRLDLDIVGLEDKVKAFTGRLSVRKRKDREPDPEPEPEIDLNAAIRDGKVTHWPS